MIRQLHIPALLHCGSLALSLVLAACPQGDKVRLATNLPAQQYVPPYQSERPEERVVYQEQQEAYNQDYYTRLLENRNKQTSKKQINIACKNDNECDAGLQCVGTAESKVCKAIPGAAGADCLDHNECALDGAVCQVLNPNNALQKGDTQARRKCCMPSGAAAQQDAQCCEGSVIGGKCQAGTANFRDGSSFGMVEGACGHPPVQAGDRIAYHRCCIKSADGTSKEVVGNLVDCPSIKGQTLTCLSVKDGTLVVAACMPTGRHGQPCSQLPTATQGSFTPSCDPGVSCNSSNDTGQTQCFDPNHGQSASGPPGSSPAPGTKGTVAGASDACAQHSTSFEECIAAKNAVCGWCEKEPIHKCLEANMVSRTPSAASACDKSSPNDGTFKLFLSQKGAS